MLNNNWVNDTTVLQVLLNAEAQLGNVMYNHTLVPAIRAELTDTQKMLHRQIECLLGPAPACYGQDDCSANILSKCPWRMTCGGE